MNTPSPDPSSAPETSDLALRQTHRPWVSLLLSLFLSGLGQFLAGDRVAGLRWFFGIWILQSLMMGMLASPVIPGVYPGVAIGLVAFACWMGMLCKSWRRIPRLNFWRWLAVVVAVLAVSNLTQVLVRAMFQSFKVPTGGMEPAIQGGKRRPDGSATVGDHVFVERYAYWFAEPKRGDIVVFRTSDVSDALRAGEFFVQRVAGIAGDTLSVKQERLQIGGATVTEPSGLAALRFPSLQIGKQLVAEGQTYQVPTNSFFVVGDNTTNSLDSRFFGPVHRGAIIGRVSKIYWPWNRAGNIEKR